ncbi:MAG: hypothetical protein ABSF83_01750 [Nitrososphaerales archaeon]
MIVIIIVVVLAIASAAAYYALSSSKVASTTSGASNTGSPVSTTTSRSTVALTTASSTKSGSSSGSAGLTYYAGSFNFSVPEGPSGVRSLSNGSAQYYNSVQTASGTFTFFIAADNLSGSGSGRGTYTMTTTGFCTGSETFPYTFSIPDATTALAGNLTIFFSNPVPGNYSVSLTCTGDMAGVSTATNDPGPFLPVYPGEFTIPLASLPTSELFHGTSSTDFVWGYSLKETS